MHIAKNDLMINEEIRDREVRLVGLDGEQFGVVSLKEARAIADERNLDLVMVAPKSTPPVCKVMDYGKYKFGLAKRSKEAKKNQKVVSTKEIHLTPNIDEHDFNTKLEHGLKFLSLGCKVKVVVRFKGRELSRPKLGEEILGRFVEATKDIGIAENLPRFEGKSMNVFISPVKK